MIGLFTSHITYLLSVLPSLLCEFSYKGNLERIKQIFEFVSQENISVEEMGVKNNGVNQGMKPTLVDTNSGGRYDECKYWTNNRSTPLMLAASSGHHQVCEYLLTKEKANLEARDVDQYTALIHAVSYDRTDVIKVLLQHKANVKAEDEGGNNAACHAAYHGYLDSLRMLAEEDGDVVDLWRNGPMDLMENSFNRRINVWSSSGFRIYHCRTKGKLKGGR